MSLAPSNNRTRPGQKTALMTRGENMRAFDDLPPAVRRELAYSRADIGCRNLLLDYAILQVEEPVLDAIRNVDERTGPARPIKPRGQERLPARSERRAAAVGKAWARAAGASHLLP